MDKKTRDGITNSRRLRSDLLNPDFPRSDGVGVAGVRRRAWQAGVCLAELDSGSSDLPIPAVLDGYHDLHLHDGDVETFVAKFRDLP